MSAVVSENGQPLDKVFGFVEPHVLPVSKACAEVGAARRVLGSAGKVTDSSLRAATCYLLRHGDWMDVQSARKMLAVLDERAAAEKIEAVYASDTIAEEFHDIEDDGTKGVWKPALWMKIAALVWVSFLIWIVARWWVA